ncbi:MAG: PD-(D/E)XK nuclease family protein [Treponema sp.]|jgi:CRISPR/Cas system-associated exonuclease Cas4 (RecB family)|nr:PD-(D/E)XK nuclease family protein [Treponema sp.]
MKSPCPIPEYILEALPDRDCNFVFPSAVPARFWLEKTALESMKPLAEERFLAWDEFKAQTLALHFHDREAAGKAARTVFAGSLLRENAGAAREGNAYLRDFVNYRYANFWEPFVSPLAALLPGLEGLNKRVNSSPRKQELLEDPWFADLLWIRQRYEVFLGTYGLYEPSWNRTDFTFADKNWILFFPELADDWEEYREELTAASGTKGKFSLRIITLKDISPPKIPSGEKAQAAARILNGAVVQDGNYIRFESAAEEQRWLALIIRQLMEEGGLESEDIIISYPGADDTERLILDLARRDIPALLRGGKSLSGYGGGRIFSSLADCVSNRWSYQSMKNLLLDQAYPWKDRESINALLDFGLRYRCMASTGEEKFDVWENTFFRLKGYRGSFTISIGEINTFYTRLKKDIRNLVNAASFEGLKEQWRIFENRYFDRDSINEDTDNILARAMKALDELILAAGRFRGMENLEEKGLVYSIFKSYLGDTKYVFQGGKQAVSIYDYKVGAGIAPLVHFVINMGQNSASVTGTEAGGDSIREDRKQLLSLRERDLSAAFARAYAFSGGFTVFSAADKTWAGPAVPLNALEGELSLKALEILSFPPEPSNTLFRVEAEEGLKILGSAGTDLRSIPLAEPLLRERLKEALGSPARKTGTNAGNLELSPTDLNEYLSCPFRWLLERGLGISEKQTGIETIDQRDLGMLYHRILEAFFLRIENDSKKFDKKKLETYRKWLNEEVDTALNNARQREGAFQESVYDMLRDRINAALEDYLETDAEILDGAEILKPEYPLRREYPDLGLAMTGKADLVLRRTEKGYILTDFKTGLMPDKKDLLADEETSPANVQLPAYINMLEHGSSGKVNLARFYSLDNREYRDVINDDAPPNPSHTLPMNRKDYRCEIDWVDRILADLVSAMNEGDYRVPEMEDRDCKNCSVSALCRSVYTGFDT